MLLHVWIYRLHQCLCTTYVSRAHRGRRRVCIPWDWNERCGGSEPGSSSRAVMPFTTEPSFQSHETVLRKGRRRWKDRRQMYKRKELEERLRERRDVVLWFTRKAYAWGLWLPGVNKASKVKSILMSLSHAPQHSGNLLSSHPTPKPTTNPTKGKQEVILWVMTWIQISPVPAHRGHPQWSLFYSAGTAKLWLQVPIYQIRKK